MSANKINRPRNTAKIEFIEKKSLFIGFSAFVENEEQALDIIKQKKKEYSDATHNVYAYVIGDNLARYSDDNEPQGTAGMPVLGAIRMSGMTDVVVVVTRYFGGVKLGAGGLVRAYTKGAKVGIDAAKVIEKVMYKEVRIKIDYNQLGKIQNEIMNMNYFVKDTIYEDNVEIIVYSRLDEVKTLTDRMTDVTSATAEVKLGDEFYLSEQNGNIIL